jgi:hypothetical protein
MRRNAVPCNRLASPSFAERGDANATRRARHSIHRYRYHGLQGLRACEADGARHSPWSLSHHLPSLCRRSCRRPTGRSSTANCFAPSVAFPMSDPSLPGRMVKAMASCRARCATDPCRHRHHRCAARWTHPNTASSAELALPDRAAHARAQAPSWTGQSTRATQCHRRGQRRDPVGRTLHRRGLPPQLGHPVPTYWPLPPLKFRSLSKMVEAAVPSRSHPAHR